ncbi:MAG: LptF/LptG family permease [Campylobacteraceae bacterium]|jgi:lipopolysaccharide export system permease protein|nr:LptF/LptG family permease [Campylobacteraceae bacterium]
MVKIYQRYVVLLYLKNFFIIFCSLEFFYASVDFITNISKLPDSANLQFLYVLFNLMSAVNYTLPLSIIFAMIVSKFSMIRSNELVSMYAVGITKNALILPIFFTALILTFIYIALNFTSFSYAYEYKSNLLKYNQILSTSSDLFLKYDGKHVYFGELNPLKQDVTTVKIFDIKDNELQEIISAQKGVFIDNAWVLEDVEIIKKPKIDENLSAKLETVKLPFMTVLEKFRPKIIENAHLGQSSLSIPDAIDAIMFFGKQGINIDSIKTNLYLIIFFPFFAPFIVVIFYYYLPLSGRFFNLALMSFIFVFAALVGWGILFVLGKFASNGVVAAEFSILLPIVVLKIIALILYRKNR